MAKKTASPKSFKGGGSFAFGANRKAPKSKTPRKSSGPRMGRGPGGFMVPYGS